MHRRIHRELGQFDLFYGSKSPAEKEWAWIGTFNPSEPLNINTETNTSSHLCDKSSVCLSHFDHVPDTGIELVAGQADVFVVKSSLSRSSRFTDHNRLCRWFVTVSAACHYHTNHRCTEGVERCSGQFKNIIFFFHTLPYLVSDTVRFRSLWCRLAVDRLSVPPWSCRRSVCPLPSALGAALCPWICSGQCIIRGRQWAATAARWGWTARRCRRKVRPTVRHRSCATSSLMTPRNVKARWECVYATKIYHKITCSSFETNLLSWQ